MPNASRRRRRAGSPASKPTTRSGKIVIHLTEPSGTFSYVLACPSRRRCRRAPRSKTRPPHPPPATGPYVITDGQARPQLGIRPQPVLGCGQRRRRCRSCRAATSTRSSSKSAATPSTQVERSRTRQGRLDEKPAAARPLRRNQEALRRHPVPRGADDQRLLLLDEHAGAALRRRAGAAAVNYAVDPAALERIYAGTLDPTPAGAAAADARLPQVRALSRTTSAKAKQLVARADPSDRKVTVWTLDLPPTDEAGEYYEQVLSELGFDVDAERGRRRQLLHPDRQLRAPRTSTPASATGCSTTRTRTTTSSRSSRAKASSPTATPTGRRSTTRRSTRKIKQLGRQQLGPQQEREYAALDREVMKQAPWAPFGTLTLGTFVADSIDLDKHRRQPDLRPGPDQLRVQVVPAVAGPGARPS